MGVILTTHEPAEPAPGWPASHVRAESVLTDLSVPECIRVTIHGVTHYLHGTTAARLTAELVAALKVADAEGVAALDAAPPDEMSAAHAELVRRGLVPRPPNRAERRRQARRDVT